MDWWKCDYFAWDSDREGECGRSGKCGYEGELIRLRSRSGLTCSFQDVPPYTVVAGNPARKIKDVPRGTNAEKESGALAALERDQKAAATEDFR